MSKTKPKTASNPPKERAGYPARALAAHLIYAATVEKRPLDHADAAPLPAADRALAHAIALTALRRLPSLDTAIASCLARPLKAGAGRAMAILRAMAAQILLMETEPHAAVSLAVDDAKSHAETRKLASLVNAVGRRMAREKTALLEGGPKHDIPGWLSKRWTRTYGEAAFAAIAADARTRPALDLTVRSEVDRDALCKELAAFTPQALTPTTIRLASFDGSVEKLPGFEEGRWWVQDVAASLPARLLLEAIDRSGGESPRILDACAAPGGKTAQLAAAGMQVTALDSSEPRMNRLASNMKRLRLGAQTLVDDALTYAPDKPFDAVLLDAPCSATGTIRRHPEVGHSRSMKQVHAHAAFQERVLDQATTWLKPAGMLVYATCSLEPEEGEGQIAAFLDRHEAWTLMPLPQWARALSQSTDPRFLRTLPGHGGTAPDGSSWNGMDGFFSTCLQKPVD